MGEAVSSAERLGGRAFTLYRADIDMKLTRGLLAFL